MLPSDRHPIATSRDVVNLRAQCLAHDIELRDQISSIFSALSEQRKQDHSFATHTKQRTLVKLFGLHASCILVSKSGRSCTTSFTGFASVAPVRIETSTRKLFTSEVSQHIVRQSPASNAVLALECSSSTRLSDNSNSLFRSVCI